nr:hypothetical protein SHINE37_30290 [Rhizobiaceae bacterium]
MRGPPPAPLCPSGAACKGGGLAVQERSEGAMTTPLCPAGHLPLKGGDRQEVKASLHQQRWKGRNGSPSNLPP